MDTELEGRMHLDREKKAGLAPKEKADLAQWQEKKADLTQQEGAELPQEILSQEKELGLEKADLLA